MAQDYNKTLNLVQTDFNMRAALPQREPGMVAKWQEDDLYHKMIKIMRANLCMFCMTALHMQTVISIWVPL